MAVIIRGKKYLDGKEYTVNIYRTQPGKLITAEDKRNAEKLDHLLSEKMKQLEQEIKSLGLLNLKNKKGKVLKLWYEVGQRLSFVTDVSLVAAEDRDFIWRALYDHAGELAPGPLTKRADRDPATSHFSYCYMLSRFPWEFVQRAGDWTSWSEFFDRKETKNDRRIIEWLADKAKEHKVRSRQNWLRPLTKAIHKAYEKIDTTVKFDTKEELYTDLNRIFSMVHENG